MNSEILFIINETYLFHMIFKLKLDVN